MPAPKKNTMAVNFRIDINIISKLQSINPAITTIDSVTGKTKFRHGALGRYIQRLIQEDINKREARKPDEILDRFRSSGGV